MMSGNVVGLSVQEIDGKMNCLASAAMPPGGPASDREV